MLSLFLAAACAPKSLSPQSEARSAASAPSPFFVQSSWSATMGDPSTLSNTLAAPTPAGNLLLVWVDYEAYPDGCDHGPVGDDAGNSYTQLLQEEPYCGTGAFDFSRLYYAVNSTDGVRTVGFTTSCRFHASFVAEYAGADPSSPIAAVEWQRYLDTDQVPDPSGHPITTASDNETVASILGGCGSTSPTAGDGWSLHFQGDGQTFPFGLEDTTVPTLQTVAPTWFIAR
jgi:hypothetical protein